MRRREPFTSEVRRPRDVRVRERRHPLSRGGRRERQRLRELVPFHVTGGGGAGGGGLWVGFLHGEERTGASNAWALGLKEQCFL